MSEERRARVLVVGHPYVTGVNQRKLDAIATLGKVEIALLVPERWWVREWGRYLGLERRFCGFPVYAAPVIFAGRNGAYLFPLGTLKNAFQEFRPDLVHTDAEAFSLVSAQIAMAARFARVPMVLHVAESVERPLRLRRVTCHFVLRSTSCLVGTNQDSLQLIRRWGYRGPGVVIPRFGVDLALFTPRRAILNQPAVVGFVGRLVREKGLEVLLEAVQRISQRGIDCRLLICGSGPQREVLQGRTRELGIEGLVEWQPAVEPDKVPQIMQRLDALVLPSQTGPRVKEQFGRVLIEAMASGVPAVGSTCGEIPNVIGRDDLVFPEGDAEALARILERLLRDRGYWEEVRAYGLARVREHFTMERVAERLVELWLQVLNWDGRGGSLHGT
jgi:glycosyltransferase involved in cell wall biosynthesis